eukprot:TRINITY_DN3752_c0_g1_i1.p1 TRINITY_DN3752_c0_g1~~TRINITY_DN3752_c0_g1_i1.p1  ORF type:complete len:215 (+),score=71.80 TRINITY_DN3752_c0_g1_i1:369-1013(+)
MEVRRLQSQLDNASNSVVTVQPDKPQGDNASAPVDQEEGYGSDFSDEGTSTKHEQPNENMIMVDSSEVTNLRNEVGTLKKQIITLKMKSVMSRPSSSSASSSNRGSGSGGTSAEAQKQIDELTAKVSKLRDENTRLMQGMDLDAEQMDLVSLRVELDQAKAEAEKEKTERQKLAKEMRQHKMKAAKTAMAEKQKKARNPKQPSPRNSNWESKGK